MPNASTFRVGRRFAVVAALFGFAAAAGAQPFPNKPLTVVVG